LGSRNSAVDYFEQAVTMAVDRCLILLGADLLYIDDIALKQYRSAFAQVSKEPQFTQRTAHHR
jgi:hypothetical protein